MGLLGSLLSLPINIINAPIKALENIFEVDEDDKLLSKPLEELSKEIKKVDE